VVGGVRWSFVWVSVRRGVLCTFRVLLFGGWGCELGVGTKVEGAVSLGRYVVN